MLSGVYLGAFVGSCVVKQYDHHSWSFLTLGSCKDLGGVLEIGTNTKDPFLGYQKRKLPLSHLNHRRAGEKRVRMMFDCVPIYICCYN